MSSFNQPENKPVPDLATSPVWFSLLKPVGPGATFVPTEQFPVARVRARVVDLGGEAAIRLALEGDDIDEVCMVFMTPAASCELVERLLRAAEAVRDRQSSSPSSSE